MSVADGGKRATEKAERWRLWVRILSVGLVLAGLAFYLRNPRTGPVAVPIAPLAVSPDRATSEIAPVEPGALRGQNLLLITLDTTRPDRLGCYGNREIETPHFDRLAADGVIFSKAIATASSTLPTHASILTGLYPERHGARANALYRLDDEHETIAETLSRNGYETAAFVSSFNLDSRFGLDRGFDLYDDRFDSSAEFAELSEQRADVTTDKAIRWLQGSHDRPFFLWVHYYDPHALYDPPPAFAKRYRLLYDGEIAFVDQQVGRLLKALGSSIDRGTFVVIVADHGEGLGEHGEWAHGYLVQEAALRIPLIMHAPKGLGRGVHVTRRVSQVDLMPTILVALGIGVPDHLDGVDLARPSDPNRAVLAETVEGRARYGWARLAAIYRGQLKYVDGPEPELYDLGQDPLERINLFTARRSEAEALRRRLEAQQGPGSEFLAPSNTDLGPADIAKLEALGYLGNVDRGAQTRRRGPDPKAMLPIMIRLQSLLSDHLQHKALPRWRRIWAEATGESLLTSPADLIVELEKLASEHPDFAPVYDYLGRFYRIEGRLEDAARAESRLAEISRRDSSDR